MPCPPRMTAVLMPMTRAVARDERSARVARVERRVGLNQVFHQPARACAQAAAERAHHAGRDRVLEAERVADGDHQLAGMSVDESPSSAGRRSWADTRSTARSVSGSSPSTSACSRRPSSSVTQVVRRPGNHVAVGEDQPVGREDETRAHAVLRLRRSRPPARRARRLRHRTRIGIEQLVIVESVRCASRSPSGQAEAAPDGFGSRRRAQLAEHRRQMKLHGVLADPEFGRDFAV